MMPSLDHCISNTSNMTTLTNTLEVFDTYKHRDDKDSDEESFHLPLDDDESDTKLLEPVKNGNGSETEGEVLDKCESAGTDYDHVDSQLEERLLNDDAEEKSEVKTDDDTATTTHVELDIPKVVENGTSVDAESEDLVQKDDESVCTPNSNDCVNGVTSDKEECSESFDLELNSSKEEDSENGTDITDIENSDKVTNEEKSEETSKDDITKSNDLVEEAEEKQCADVNEQSALDLLEKSINPELELDVADPCKVDAVDDNATTESVNAEDEQQMNDKSSKDEIQMNNISPPRIQEDASSDDKAEEKCDNSNDSTKHHNEDSEDLFDISIIRDAEEDNAESAYNEAHSEENHLEETEDFDERNDDKMEEDCVTEKASNVEGEDDDEIDIDKHDDHLKTDDVEIEEENLKLDCDGIKETVSDVEGDAKKTDLVQTEQTTSETTPKVKRSITECRLDEVTGKLIGSDDMEISFDDNLEESNNLTKETGEDSADSNTRKSLKRTISEESETGVAKKSRTELDVADVEIKEVDKPKEKLPLRTLLSLSNFMKTKKSIRRLNMNDLEEFCIQKMCEVIVHKSELGDVLHQLKMQEQLVETMRKEIQQLTKQSRDLEIVNKKLMNDLKQQTATQKPLNPLKITRSVGLQVKFTPAFEVNMKRRQTNTTVVNQKVQLQTTNRGPRNVTNTATSTANRQATTPQKQQQQQLPKPNTPLLSQALQNRRTSANDTTNKMSNQAMRPKPADSKSGTPSASVIDLTDEDDKKDKSKSSPTKMVAPKNITVPLRTPMRVNATAQGIRLTTSQGKVSPITSVVTSSAPQVMYVVQSSPQNVLTSGLGSKAVVVNFQSANASALNGSAVSVIPKQSNTIQLKTVAPVKTVPNNKVIKMPNKHPAPLPTPPLARISSDKPLKPIPPKPHLTIRKTDTGIILQWKMPYELDMYEVIASYQLYAYQETSALPSTDMWRKVGDVKALALPMACTLTQFADKNKYYFAVRPVDIHKRIGMFSEPEEISL